MFSRFYAKRAAAIAPAAYVARDSRTRQIIARGNREEMAAFLAAFGHCYIEAA